MGNGYQKKKKVLRGLPQFNLNLKLNNRALFYEKIGNGDFNQLKLEIINLLFLMKTIL